MKLKIDFTNKVITVEEQCNAAELFQKIQELFPNDVWKEFKLETPVQYLNNNWWWQNPIPVFPLNPYPITVYDTGTIVTDFPLITSASEPTLFYDISNP